MKEEFVHGKHFLSPFFIINFESKKARCQNGVMFAVKAELKRRPYLMLGVLMLFTIIYLGLAMRTFEMYLLI